MMKSLGAVIEAAETRELGALILDSNLFFFFFFSFFFSGRAGSWERDSYLDVLAFIRLLVSLGVLFV